MAAKGKGKPATPKKFKQARADARPAAKAAFSGNKKAGLKDPTIKLSADDKKAIAEMQKAGAADKRAGLTQADTDYRAAERQRALDRFRQGEPTVSSTAAKPTPVSKAAPSKPRLQGTSQKAASKPVSSKGKSLVENGKVVSLERAKEIMSNKPGAATTSISKAEFKAQIKKALDTLPGQKETLAKTKVNKPSTTRTATRGAGSVVKSGKSVAIRPDAVISPKTGKEVAIRPKGTVTTPSAKGGTPAVREAKVTVIPRPEASKPKFARSRKVGKGLLAGAVGSEIVSAVKGSTDKDLKELDRLKAKLAKAQGKTYKPGFFGNLKADTAGEVSQLANLASMGLVGKTRRQYMDELNAKIAKAEKARSGVSMGRAGGAKAAAVSGASMGKAGGAQAATAVKKPQIPAGGPSGGSAAGKASSAKTVAPGGLYTVQKGDTLWDIAKRHNVTLKQVRDANPVFKENPKYKNGSMIWSGTKVRIPGK